MGLSIDIDVAFTDATLPILYDDSIITEYTKYCLDGLDALSWPEQNAPEAADQWLDLTPNKLHASINGGALPGFAGGGFTFGAPDNPQRITLPAAAKIAASSKGFLSVLWLRIEALQASLRRVAGFHYNGTGPWGLYSNGNLSYVHVFDGGSNTRSFSAAGVHQIGYGRCSDGAGGFLRKLYVDGVEVASGASGATAAQPSTVPANATIGDDAGSGLGGDWLGSCYRHWLADVGAVDGVFTSPYLADLVSRDWNDNRLRAWA